VEPTKLALEQIYNHLEKSSLVSKAISIAIDGHSSTGKSTMAKALAERLAYTYIDTGAMYRGVTLFALREKLLKDPEGLISRLSDLRLTFASSSDKAASDLHLNGENVEQEIRNQNVAEQVSKIARLSAVRRFLVAQQQQMAERGGVVMDGRDIGTVVLPEAELKIFMTARPEIRAQRRFEELIQKGEQVSLEQVAQNLMERDKMDSERADSPLKVAEGAKILDNSDLDQEEQLRLALGWVEEVRA
jgi:cytidylate kinase